MLLDYNPKTGVFTWLVNRGGTARAGTVAGTSDCLGYISISINGRRYKAGQLAFLWMTGRFPKKMADHEDTNPSNNKWSNLRKATRSQNGANRKKNKNNSAGYKGVSYSKRDQLFNARIQKNGVSKWLGYFDSAIKAHEAYKIAARSKFKEFSRFE